MKLTILWKRNVPNLSSVYIETLQTPKPLKEFLPDEWICGFKEIGNGMGLVLDYKKEDGKGTENFRTFLKHQCNSWKEYESWLQDQVWEIRVDDEILYSEND